MRIAKKKKTKKQTKATEKSQPKPTKLGQRDGCEVQVRIRERSGKTTDIVERMVVLYAPAPARKKRPGQRGSSNRPPAQLSNPAVEAFAALGHPQRVRMLFALLDGPATYKAIQKATKLTAGPLYHHINQLRLAGLIAPRQRDLYELTRGGRNIALLAIAAAPLIKDARRRLNG